MDVTQLKTQLDRVIRLLRWAYFFLKWPLLQRAADVLGVVISDPRFEPLLELVVYLESQGSYLDLLQYLADLLAGKHPAATVAALKARRDSL